MRLVATEVIIKRCVVQMKRCKKIWNITDFKANKRKHCYRILRSIIVWGLLLLLSFSVAQVNADNDKPLEEVTLQLSWYHEFHFAGYYAAQLKGYYKEEGLEVEIKERKPDLLPADAVLSGEADFGNATSDLMFLRMQGKPVVALAVIMQHSPWVLLVRADSGITVPEDLIGKTVSMDMSYRDVEVQAMFKDENISTEDMTIVRKKPGVENLINSTVDAQVSYITSQPFELQKQGYEPRVIRPVNYGVDFYGDTLFTSERQIREHPQRVAAFRRASLRGWQYAMDNTEELIDYIYSTYYADPTKATIPYSREHLSFEAQVMVQDLMHPKLIQIGHMNPHRWQHIAETYVALGMAEPIDTLNGFIYDPNPGPEHKWAYWTIGIIVAILILVGVCVAILYVFNKRLNRDVQLRTSELTQTNKALIQEIYERKMAEEKITSIAHILEESLNEIYIFDAKTFRFIRVNKGARLNLGYSMEELSSLTPLDLNPEMMSGTFVKLLEPLRTGEKGKIQFITIHRRKDGSFYDVETHLQLSTFQSVPVFVAIILDITERKRGEDLLKESEKRLNQAQEIGHLGSWHWNLKTGKLIWSDETFRIFGLSPGGVEPSYELFLDFVHSDDREALKEAVEASLNQKSPYNVECRIIRKDGSIRVSNARGEVRCDEEGKPEVMHGFIQDITEHKQVEAELKELNETLENRVTERTSEVAKLYHAIEHSSATIVITDVEGNIEYVNPGFTQTTGYSPEEAIGKNTRILKSGKRKPEFYRELWSTITSGREWKGEFHNIKKNGELYWEFSSISPVKDRNGVITNFVAVKENITERKKSESRLKDASEKAQRATEAKSAFLSSMSHELRTPLNSILGFAQLLMTNQKEPLAESQKERVQHILNAGGHLLDLISEVLDLSSIESGKLPISPDTVNVGSVINEAVTAVVPMAQQFNIKVNNKTNHCDHYIVADRTRLKQVLDNLLTNAIKYNHPGGSVTISCEAPNTHTLRINVDDTGLGFAAKDIEALFEPFNRLGRESLNIEGTGVGLTITKTLVEYMGGSIGIESKEGKGSKFFVTFNKANPPVLEGTENKYLPEEKHLEKMAEGKTMLYVEDDYTNLTLVKNILRRRPNVKLLTALDAESGIEIVRTQHPDLILMDINLPKMDGYEALKKLKSNDATKRIPAIAISADAMPDSIKKGKTAGFLEYITKPLNVNHFLDVIDNIFKEERR